MFGGKKGTGGSLVVSEADGIPLGSKVRDSVTGFSGVAAAQARYMYGCNRILIEPDKLDDKGRPIEPEWIDEQRVELVEARESEVSEHSTAQAGGPQNDAPKR